MIKTFKNIIANLAKNAVIAAEEEYGSGQGKIKKQKAIAYIIEHLPFSPFINKIIGLTLSTIIDELIETSVAGLHEMQQIQGE